jgi:phosphate transport system substrate-binding protein
MAIAQKTFAFHLLALAFFLAALSTESVARDQIRIVGSSTIFPFAATVAEQFGRKTKYKTPVVEATGSGGGMKLFCSGIGENYPDITNASRRIKKSEYKKCRANGINIIEVKIGFDGIVLASSKESPPVRLTRKQIFQALAAHIPNSKGKLIKNPYKKWSEISPSLPNTKIEVLGPPPSSGTRDAFIEIAMEGGAKKFDYLARLKEKDKKKFKGIAHAIREDGAFVEAGENDNLIVQKLLTNKNAFGIFGFSFLDNNKDRLQGAPIEGASPTFDNIADGKYSISRSLYFYVKANHFDKTLGLTDFIKEFTHRRTWGDNGYLSQKGLIPLPKAERRKIVRQIEKKTTLKLK